jgi:hypothetical protein
MSEQPMYDRDGTMRMIRMCFYEQQRQRMQGVRKYNKNSRHDNEDNWYRAADACLAAKANPQDWVQAAFLYSKSKTMFANTLHGPAAAAWYREYQRSRTGNAERAAQAVQARVANPEALLFVDTVVGDLLSDQIELAVILMQQRAELPERWTYEASLMDPYLSIPSYIRVAIAGRWGRPDIVARWAQEAREFFSTHPDHCETLCLMGFNVKEYLNAKSNQP